MGPLIHINPARWRDVPASQIRKLRAGLGLAHSRIVNSELADGRVKAQTRSCCLFYSVTAGPSWLLVSPLILLPPPRLQPRSHPTLWGVAEGGVLWPMCHLDKSPVVAAPCVCPAPLWPRAFLPTPPPEGPPGPQTRVCINTRWAGLAWFHWWLMYYVA